MAAQRTCRQRGSSGDHPVQHHRQTAGGPSQEHPCKAGQIQPSHSISAGLDYPGVGPEHAWLQATGRAFYGLATDAEALRAFTTLCRAEGILPALESSHALAWVLEHAEKLRAELPEDANVVVNLSGRGDKDLDIIETYLPR